MINKFLINLFFFFIINISIFAEVKAQINNSIVVKVGNTIISSIDIQNEIITYLYLRKIEITQENINNVKNDAVKNLINISIKRSEINKRKVTIFNKEDLKNHIEQVAARFETNTDGLKTLFEKNKLNYDVYIEQYKVQLLWNTLIYQIYQNQININPIELENDVQILANSNIFEYNLSEIEISNSEFNKQKINEILEMIKNESFEFVAKKISISPTAKNGGLVGWLSSASLSNKYLEKIKNLDIKEISKPILNENSVSILRVNDIKEQKRELDKEKIKNQVINKKKKEKLSLFSRSHFSNLENTVSVNFL